MKFILTGTESRLAAVATSCLLKKWTRKVSAAWCPGTHPTLSGGKRTGGAITRGRRDGNTGERWQWDADGHVRCRL